MFANLLGRLGQLFAQPATQAIAAGLLTGTIGASVLLASGVFSSGATASQTVALLACPGSGPVLARIAHGQQTLVTARSANGEWLEVYLGEPGVQRAWAPAQALRLQAGVDRLPVHDCSAPGHSAAPTVIPTLGPPPTVAPTVGPGASSTPAITTTPSAAPSPTPSPTRTPKPTAKPTPTPFVDVTSPTLSNLLVTNPLFFGGRYTVYNSGSSCSHTFTVQVTATDPDDAVSTVTLFYQGTGETALSAAMAFVPALNAWRYTATVPAAWDIDDVITFWARGSDAHGNQSANLYNDPVSQKVIIDFCPPA